MISANISLSGCFFNWVYQTNLLRFHRSEFRLFTENLGFRASCLGFEGSNLGFEASFFGFRASFLGVKNLIFGGKRVKFGAERLIGEVADMKFEPIDLTLHLTAIRH